jgi:phosphatidylglycerophosphate synthase
MPGQRTHARLGSALASGLIGLRLLAAAALPVAILGSAQGWALAALGVAVLSDALDGVAGRRWGGCPFLGPFSDALADCAVVLAACSAFALRGALPAWAPVLVAAMFVQFAWSSGWRRPLYDPLGKYYGLALYALVGALLMAPRPALSTGGAIALLLLSAAALVSRLAFLRRSRLDARPILPVEETRGR